MSEATQRPLGQVGSFDAQEVPVYEQANYLLKEGRLGEAGDHLFRAAAEAVALDDTPAAIRLLQLSANTARSAGSPEDARARAEWGVSLAAGLPTPDPALSVLMLSEAAECALALGDSGRAGVEFGEAAAIGGLPDAVRAALLRRQSAALASQKDFAGARRALDEVLGIGSLAPVEAARIRLDVAGIAQQGRLPDRGEAVERARTAVDENPGADLHADLALLESAVASERGDLAIALDFAHRARAYALEADAPVAYLAASLSEAEFVESLGGGNDHVYTVLAEGWSVLERLAGPDIARAAFADALTRRREAWGEVEYAAVAARYDNSHVLS